MQWCGLMPSIFSRRSSSALSTSSITIGTSLAHRPVRLARRMTAIQALAVGSGDEAPPSTCCIRQFSYDNSSVNDVQWCICHGVKLMSVDRLSRPTILNLFKHAVVNVILPMISSRSTSWRFRCVLSSTKIYLDFGLHRFVLPLSWFESYDAKPLGQTFISNCRFSQLRRHLMQKWRPESEKKQLQIISPLTRGFLSSTYTQ